MFPADWFPRRIEAGSNFLTVVVTLANPKSSARSKKAIATKLTLPWSGSTFANIPVRSLAPHVPFRGSSHSIDRLYPAVTCLSKNHFWATVPESTQAGSTPATGNFPGVHLNFTGK
uniref:(northern house mosquito) hypothetical protein n=1 Tax=Culex pipiens TaxID=7175 RepID=A0A8D8MSK1_CULPI